MICTAPAECAVCGARIEGSAGLPAWTVVTCGDAACVAHLEGNEVNNAAEYARRERCHGNSAACEHEHATA